MTARLAELECYPVPIRPTNQEVVSAIDRVLELDHLGLGLFQNDLSSSRAPLLHVPLHLLRVRLPQPNAIVQRSKFIAGRSRYLTHNRSDCRLPYSFPK